MRVRAFTRICSGNTIPHSSFFLSSGEEHRTERRSTRYALMVGGHLSGRDTDHGSPATDCSGEESHVARRSQCPYIALSVSNEHARNPGWCILALQRFGATGAGKPILAAGCGGEFAVGSTHEASGGNDFVGTFEPYGQWRTHLAAYNDTAEVQDNATRVVGCSLSLPKTRSCHLYRAQSSTLERSLTVQADYCAGYSAPLPSRAPPDWSPSPRCTTRRSGHGRQDYRPRASACSRWTRAINPVRSSSTVSSRTIAVGCPLSVRHRKL
jgi:hypothetical protein